MPSLRGPRGPSGPRGPRMHLLWSYPTLVVCDDPSLATIPDVMRADGVSRLHATVNGDGDLHVASLHVDAARRGRGVGSGLLVLAIGEARRIGCRHVTLDDMTDRARMPRNIYVSHGFVYADAVGPEMTLSLA